MRCGRGGREGQEQAAVCRLASSRRPLFTSLHPCSTPQVLVRTLDGGRRRVLLRSSCSLAALRLEVQRESGVPASSLRLTVEERRPLGRFAAALRLLLAALLAAAAWVVAVGRHAAGLPAQRGVQLRLETESGREIELEVRVRNVCVTGNWRHVCTRLCAGSQVPSGARRACAPHCPHVTTLRSHPMHRPPPPPLPPQVDEDMSLREMRRLVWERHGEELSLSHLSLSCSPSRGSGKGGGGGGAAAPGGGGGDSVSRVSPAKRRLRL